MWDVARFCSHYISAYFGLCDAVVNTFTSENCCVLFLKLDSDFEIRLLQRKLGSDTTTSFFGLQSQFNKAVCNSPMEVEPTVLVLASRLKVNFFSGPPSVYGSYRLRRSDTNPVAQPGFF